MAPKRTLGRGRPRADEPVISSNDPPGQEPVLEPPPARRRMEEDERLVQMGEEMDRMRRQLEESQRLIEELRRAREIPPPAPVPPAPVPLAPAVPPVVIGQGDVPPQRQAARRHIDEGGVSVSSFMKYRLPEFKGQRGDDPTEFLEQVDKIVRRLPCSDARAIELVGLLLIGQAWRWFGLKVERDLYSEAPPTWEQFRQMMLDEFLTSGERLSRAIRFERLRQGGRTVAEYADEFLQLSSFAADIAPTEGARIERFKRGLITPIYDAVVAGEYASLTILIDRAQQVEARHRDDRNRAQNREQGGQGGRDRQGKGSIQQRAPEADRQSRGQTEAHSEMPPPKKPQNTPSSSQQRTEERPKCTYCGNRHPGECRLKTGACLRCGQQGHFKRDCPIPQGTAPSSIASQPTVQNMEPRTQETVNRDRGKETRSAAGPSYKNTENARIFSLNYKQADPLPEDDPTGMLNDL